MSLSTKISNLELDSCLMNASGPKCTTLSELLDLQNSNSGCIVSKSATLESRVGNPEPRYWDDELGSINSMGLPNKGYQYYLDSSKVIDKPFIMSINGLTLDDTLRIVSEVCLEAKVKGMEINLSCPNIIGKGQLAYDLEKMDTYLEAVFLTLAKQENRVKDQIIGIHK